MEISNAPASDVAACCDLCSAAPACKAFTWDQYSGTGAKQGTCYLKNGCPTTTPNGATTAGRQSSPSPPSPGPSPPSPSPSPSPGNLTQYCPIATDWTLEYGNGEISDAGWSITGGGRVASKSTFNVLGGYISFTMNTTRALTNVNSNFYVTSPPSGTFPAYCDIQGSPGCLELDFIEANGRCITQTTWHTENGIIGRGNCDKGGCGGTRPVSSPVFNVKASFSVDGAMTVTIDGATINVNPQPDGDAVAYVHDTVSTSGVQIHSSQWVGWVPGGNCGPAGSLEASTFSISNVKILAREVVQGESPSICK